MKEIFNFLVLGILSTSIFGQQTTEFIVTGGIQDNDPNFNNVLSDAITSLNSKGTITIKGNITVSEDFVIPKGIELNFFKGNKIIIDNGVIFQLNGSINAGIYQIFNGNVTGKPVVEKLYPQWFGAKGDGVSIDHTAIQTAINLLSKSTDQSYSGGILYFPKGKYKVEESIVIDKNQHHSLIFGNNQGGTSRIFNTSNNKAIFKVKGLDVRNYLLGVQFKHLIIQGHIGIETYYTADLTVDKCTFSITNNTPNGDKKATGILLAESENSQENGQEVRTRIINSRFSGSRDNANSNFGIYSKRLSRIADIDIKNNIFTDLSESAINLGYMDGGVIAENKFFSDISNGSPHGIVLGKPIWAIIKNNHIFNNRGNGILLKGPRWSICNENMFVNTGKDRRAALRVQSFDATVIDPNDKVHLGSNNQFIGNIFNNCFTSAIKFISLQTNKKMSNNLIENNQIYGSGYTGIPAVDAIVLENCKNFQFKDTYVNGTATEIVEKQEVNINRTRYWLNVKECNNITFSNTKFENTLESDLFRNGSTQLTFENSNQTKLINSNYKVISTDKIILGSGFNNIYLPSANIRINPLTIKLVTNGQLNIIPKANQTIDDQPILSLKIKNDAISLISNGQNWYIIQ